MIQQEKEWYELLYAQISQGSDKYSESVKLQTAVWEDRIPDKQPLLLSCSPPGEYAKNIPNYNTKEIHNDKTKMLISGMKSMLSPAFSCMQSVPSIRANMGCGIYPSLFPGIKPMLFDDGKMPWIVSHLGYDELRNMQEKDIQITDEFQMALEHTAYIAEHISGSGAFVFQLDLQDPFAVAHLVYGNEIFYALYEEPEFVHHLLELSCRAIELGLAECLKIIPGSANVLAHYNNVVIPRSRGGLKISLDTATLLGGEHIEEFVLPYTNRVLDLAGGGYIHYCGRNDRLFDLVLRQDKIYGLNFGQPDMHDMNDVLKKLSQAGKIYYGTVPKQEGEDYAAYFSRVRTAATTDGKCRLLLELGAAYDKQEAIKSAWESIDVL